MEELLIDLGFAQKHKLSSLVVYEKEYQRFTLSVYWSKSVGVEKGVAGDLFIGKELLAFVSIPDPNWLTHFDLANA